MSASVPLARCRALGPLGDIDLVEMHEAFASQVASNIQALESETWAKDKLGRTEAVGKIDRSRLNVNGGEIATRHPLPPPRAGLTPPPAPALKRRGARL